jgi:hypothetical protein
MLRIALIPVAFALVLGACTSDTVRLPDCVDCRPVEMHLDQQFEAEVGWGVRPGQQPAEYTWIVADPGTMRIVSSKVIERSEGPGEFVGDVSYSSMILLKPTEAGTTTVRFELHDADGNLRSDLVEGQLNELAITVVVTE